MNSIVRHQQEIDRNRRIWERKPILREIYGEFYRRIAALVRADIPGRVVEAGSGIGNLKSAMPDAISTDLFPNPWLDLVCDAYDLPFRDGSVSNLVMFDVFHHLEHPAAFLREARRVLAAEGRLVVFDPYISLAGRVAYGAFHPEPLGLGRPISESPTAPRPRRYFAAQGNATRLFFRGEGRDLLSGWEFFHREAFSAFGYLLSGGYSRPALYPGAFRAIWSRCDEILSRWPGLFAARCLVGLRKAGGQARASASAGFAASSARIGSEK